MDQQPTGLQVPGSAPLNESQHRTLMGILSYLGILVIIPIVMTKDPFVKFHIKQGLVLVVAELILWFVLNFFVWQLWMIWDLINLGVLVLAIIGIMNVVNGKEQELPLVGSLASYIPF
jgi:uncharacterized membrane protein